MPAHPLDRPRRDVASDLHPLELDPRRGLVRALARGAGSGPSPVTFSTRPPAVTISPSRSAVPAWVTSAISAAASSPEITSPFDEEAG